MGSLANLAEDKILDHLLNGTSWTTAVGCRYIGLVTTALTDTATIATAIANEANYTGYARVDLGLVGGTWAPASGGSVSNDVAITFPYTSGTNTIKGWFLTNHATAGTDPTDYVTFYGTIADTVISSTQNPPTFAIGALTISAD